MQRRRIVDELRRQLLAELPSEILRITVFGSHARDEATPESDLDVFNSRTRGISNCHRPDS